MVKAGAFSGVTPGAIAIFVKTPGLSNVKTRLAKAVGKEIAEKFYSLSVSATEAVIHQAVTYSSWLTPYWAIAEEQGMVDSRWARFARVYQGEGDLGTRLDRIYSELLKKHRFVLLMGADSPHLTVEQLLQPALHFCSGESTSQFAVGPTDDGGFYLFGGSKPVPQNIWQEVPYSQTNTTSELLRLLTPLGSIKLLPSNFDIDTLGDLEKLTKQNTFEFLLEQRAAVTFAQEVLKNLKSEGIL